ncbi:MAG: PD-(D/E)XK nuclease-like domain-containing protein [Ilumatobacteraceae bacterium]
MIEQDYHKDTTRISKSGLDLIAKSPAHYWQKYLNPNREPDSPTPALVIGAATHMATLEPAIYPTAYATAPVVDRRTKDGKQAFADFELANEGKTILTADQGALVESIADAVRLHPNAGRLINPDDGAAEIPVLWIDQDTGAPCKCRPDFANTRLNALIDLKTTDDASPAAFARSVYNYRYHVQAAMYSDAWEQANNLPAPAFIFIAVEKTPPFAVAIYVLDDAAINLGRATYKENLQTYMSCRELNHWPAYSENIQPLSLPSYAK